MDEENNSELTSEHKSTKDKTKDKKKTCPKCGNGIPNPDPFKGIRPDPTLQDIVYKIVPGLYKDEMSRRKMVYQAHPDAARAITSGELKGEYSGERTIYSADDIIPLSIEYSPEVISYSYPPLTPSTKSSTPICIGNNSLSSSASNTNTTGSVDTAKQNDKNQSIETNYEPVLKKLKTSTVVDGQKRYLRCIAAVTIRHLKKLIRNKYDLKYHHDVQMFYKHDSLLDEFSILDLAYIYSWKRNGPLALYYTISDLRRTEFKKVNNSENKCPSTEDKSNEIINLDLSNKSSVSVSTSPIPCSISPQTSSSKSPSIAQLNCKSTPQAICKTQSTSSLQGSVQNSSKVKSHTNVKVVPTSSLSTKGNVKQVETLNNSTNNASLPRKHANENNSASGNSKNSTVAQNTSLTSSKASNSGVNASLNVTASPTNTPTQVRRSRGGTKGKRPLTVREIVDGVSVNSDTSSPASDGINNHQGTSSHQPHLLPKTQPVATIANNFFCSSGPLTFSNGLSLSPSVTAAANGRNNLGQILMHHPTGLIPTTLSAPLISQLFSNSLMPIGSSCPSSSPGIVQGSNSAFTRISEPPVIQTNSSPIHNNNNNNNNSNTNVSSPAISSPSLTMCSPNTNANGNNSSSSSNTNNSPHQQNSITSSTTVTSTGQSTHILSSSSTGTNNGNNVLSSNSTSLVVTGSSISSTDAESCKKSPPSPSSALAIAQQALPQSTTVTAIKDSSSNKAKISNLVKRIDGVIEKLREKDKSTTVSSNVQVTNSTPCSSSSNTNSTESLNKLNAKSIVVSSTNSTALATVAPITSMTTGKIGSISTNEQTSATSGTTRNLPSSLANCNNSANTINRSSHIPIIPAFDKKPVSSHSSTIHSKHASSNAPLASSKSPMPSSNQIAQNSPQSVTETSTDRSKECTKEVDSSSSSSSTTNTTTTTTTTTSSSSTSSSSSFSSANSQVVSNLQSNKDSSTDEKSTIDSALRAIIAQAGKLCSPTAEDG